MANEIRQVTQKDLAQGQAQVLTVDISQLSMPTILGTQTVSHPQPLQALKVSQGGHTGKEAGQQEEPVAIIKLLNVAGQPQGECVCISFIGL